MNVHAHTIKRVKQKIAKHPKRKGERSRTKTNIESLRDEAVRGSYQEATRENIQIDNDIEGDIEKIERIINKATQTLSKRNKRQQKGRGYDEECEEKRGKKNQVRQELLDANTPQNKEKYNRIRRETKNYSGKRKENLWINK